MKLLDGSVLVHAYMEGTPHHLVARDWLRKQTSLGVTLAVWDVTLVGVVRVVTHRKLFAKPAHLTSALEFVSAVRALPTVKALEPGPGYWPIFQELAPIIRDSPALLTDVALGALAIERDATLVTLDRDFIRLPGLRLDYLVD